MITGQLNEYWTAVVMRAAVCDWKAVVMRAAVCDWTAVVMRAAVWDWSKTTEHLKELPLKAAV